MDLTKLGRSERVLAIVGLLAFIDSFLPWYSVSFKGELGVIAGGSVSGNAWDVGFWAWFPMLLLLAVAVLLVLPAFGQNVSVRGGYASFGAASLLATIIVLIRWLSYPTVSDAYGSAGADFGTYIGLILGIVATVFAYLGFTAAGGTLNNIGAAFKGQPAQEGGYTPPAGGYVPPASGYAQPGDQPPTWGQQPPQQ
ncbi:MAG TPA: hypothetical protein VFA06_18165 [Actinocrinis sp.]|uniref:hypothetical protein n=1 Tax=Actinocrinis sp. TaxID=1920516 RepID=UPI002D5A3752|nr:hypothetical protein [Actinocrinis sp.]HZU57803.1 hypothetical protein [Actinocrinis sp.]